MQTIRPHIERAIRIYGSQARLADVMGCSQQQISYLLNAKSISAEMAKMVDEATGGRVSRHALRPDIYGHLPSKKEAAE
ncbi:YdaS family helix-turn-helix protein [Haematobacter sp.]|uniref:YdaS family helix-turn-helix protein n=1 Tax=Haematobacter sp. TaxID=2953762 RepID=UPI0028A71203|nr:YdaS family helix-turn-helix protein [Haematobacter sp.]